MILTEDSKMEECRLATGRMWRPELSGKQIRQFPEQVMRGPINARRSPNDWGEVTTVPTFRSGSLPPVRPHMPTQTTLKTTRARCYTRPS